MRDELLNAYLSHPHNFTNPETRGQGLVIGNAILIGFVSTFFFLRVYTRITITRSLGWDDVAVALGFLFTVGLTADVILADREFYW
jgi:hypothetical protein